MRLFAALEVPGDVRREVDRAVAPLRGARDELRWTPPEQWHVTVAFVGEVAGPPSDVAALLAEPATGSPEAIHLSLADAGRFGRRVLWLGVSDRPRGAVAELGAAAQAALVRAGLPVDTKDVHPHLTLARAHRRGGGRVDADLVEAVPPVEAAWEVGELVLLASIQRGDGRPNRYEAQARIPLGR